MSANRVQLPSTETHSIELAEGSRVVSTSDGLPWANIFASVTSERRWAGSLMPINHVCFAYCLRRSARIERRIDGETAVSVLALHPRQFGIIPTRVASSFRLTGTADIMMIYLRGSMVERIAQEVFNRDSDSAIVQPHVGFYDPMLEQVAMEIAAALDRRNVEDDPPYIDQLAGLAASHLVRNHAERKDAAGLRGTSARQQSAFQALLPRMERYIEDNLRTDLSLRRLAREAGLTQAGLTTLFATSRGYTPHQYVIKRRLDRAGQLLIATELPIAEIALQTGFSSQSHLSDAFKRVTGDTPKAFRNTCVARVRAAPGASDL